MSEIKDKVNKYAYQPTDEEIKMVPYLGLMLPFREPSMDELKMLGKMSDGLNLDSPETATLEPKMISQFLDFFGKIYQATSEEDREDFKRGLGTLPRTKFDEFSLKLFEILFDQEKKLPPSEEQSSIL